MKKVAQTVTPAVTTTTTVAGGAPAAVVQPRPRQNNAFPWRRLMICVIGVVILMLQWRWATFYLYTLPQHTVTVFGSITNSTQYAITFIVAYFITGQVYFTNWSLASTTSMLSEVKSYFENKKSEKTERIIKPKYLDDGTIS